MNKNQLIELTNKLYQLTLLFPKKEPLRSKMREIGNEILDCLSRKNYRDVGPLIEALDGFLELARAQDWVKQEKVLNLQLEYSKVREELNEEIKRLRDREIKEPEELASQANKEIAPTVRDREYSNSEFEYPVNERQEKIVAFLKEKGSAQVKDLQEILQDVTKRTLRRDFKVLLKQGVVERVGQRNETYYRLKGPINK